MVESNFAAESIKEKRDLVSKEKKYIQTSGLETYHFAKKIGANFYGYGSLEHIISESFMIRVDKNRRLMNVKFMGTPSSVNQMIEYFNKDFQLCSAEVRWVCSENIDVIDFPLSMERPLVEEAYPNLKVPFHHYVKAFADSTANLLILRGPPGVGKTSFILNAAISLGESIMVAYGKSN